MTHNIYDTVHVGMLPKSPLYQGVVNLVNPTQDSLSCGLHYGI